MDKVAITTTLETLVGNIKPLDPFIDRDTTDSEREYFRYYGIDFEGQFPEVKHHFGSLKSAEYTIAVHYYEMKAADGTCLIVHGYYDHSGLYGRLIEYCLKRNLSVVICDLPGHGLSSGERATIASFADYQTVVTDVVEHFSLKAPRPWFAIGQSTGGAILMDFLLSAREPVFSKTVLLAPLVKPVNWSSMGFLHSLAKVFASKFARRFAENSHDRHFLQFVKNDDPLQSRYLSVQWVTALKQWINYFEHLRFVDYAPLIIQGKEDQTVDWKYNVPAIEKKFPNSKLYYLKDGRHHLANESDTIMANIYSAMDMYFDVSSTE